ncbi:MAG TPA: carboxypeptidase-like regulatory domain-containing protein [Smithella sp.]|nr:carboxypeptidase-like regulatory domain-containing protein [Smithella sp.]
MKKTLGVILLGILITLFAGCSSGGNTPPPATFTISGTVSGSIAANVTIYLASGVTTSTKTASDGTYSFTGLGTGYYTVTPVSTGYIFTPPDQVVLVNGKDVTGQNFISTPRSPVYIGEWTWVSGSNTYGQRGIYVTSGTPDAGNLPGARSSSVSWIDGGGNFWLFGGYGYDSAANVGLLNDLWEFDGANWTWVSGSNTYGQQGLYVTKGTPDPGNMPGSRSNSVSWMDGSGNFWLFGGNGYDSANAVGPLNDLWKFDGADWTWVSGSNTYGQTGSYGTKGSSGPGNIPGARSGSVSWIDTGGNLWLFGGIGYDSTGAVGLLNDLWKFDGTNWTWVSGAKTYGQAGSYITKGTSAAGNFPGARSSSVSWIDGGGNLWLFGGYGYDSAGNVGLMNDLWVFDGTNWAWESGSNTNGQRGSSVAIGVADAGNIPGARQYSISWIDGSGNLWLFGGNGYDFAANINLLNDLWEFDGTDWIWIGGYGQASNYGTKGTAAANNIPGTRSSSVSWIDGGGNLWLFGGIGYDSAGNKGNLNDLWRYQP